jgi:hypothetical protein
VLESWCVLVDHQPLHEEILSLVIRNLFLQEVIACLMIAAGGD